MPLRIYINKEERPYIKEYGVYAIENLENGKIYVGVSYDEMIYHRLSIHMNSLRLGTHHNKELQEDYNRYGWNKLKYTLLKKINPEDTSVEQVNKLESHYIKLFGPKAYNVRVNQPSRYEVVLLDLIGRKVGEFVSLEELRRFLGGKVQIPSYKINSESKFRGRYRIVSKDFYLNNYKTWMKWSSPVNKKLQKKLKYINRNRVAAFNKEGKMVVSGSFKDVAKAFGLTPQAINSATRKGTLIQDQYKILRVIEAKNAA